MQRSSTTPVFIQQTPGPGTRTRAPQVGQLHPTGARGPGVPRLVSAFRGPWLAQPQSRATEGPSQRACHSPLSPTPALCFPGWILGFPQCKSWLSTLKCFNLLHPPRRALREAGRRPGLRTIKQLPAGGAPVGAGRPVGEMGGPFTRGCREVSLHNHRMKAFGLHLTLMPSPLFPWLLLSADSIWHPWATPLPALRVRARPESPVGPGHPSSAFGLESNPVSSLRSFEPPGCPGWSLSATAQEDSGPPGTPADTPVPSLTRL